MCIATASGPCSTCHRNSVQVWEHSGGANSAVISSDERLVATAGSDRPARVWRLKTGEPVTPPLPHPASVVSVEFRPDLARGHHRVRRRRRAGLERDRRQSRLPVLRHEDEVRSAVFSHDGRSIATASLDGTAGIWDSRTGHRLATLSHRKGEDVFVAAFSPDDRQVATAGVTRESAAGEAAEARLWDARTGALLATLPHESFVERLSYSPDGSRLVTSGGDQTARIWDTRSGREATPPLRHTNLVQQAEFFAGGSRVATTAMDQSFHFWDAATGHEIGTPIFVESGTTRFAVRPDGQVLAAISDDGKVYFLDLQSGKRIGTSLRHSQPGNGIRFSASGQHLLTTSVDGTARYWNWPTPSRLIEGSGTRARSARSRPVPTDEVLRRAAASGMSTWRATRAFGTPPRASR